MTEGDGASRGPLNFNMVLNDEELAVMIAALTREIPPPYTSEGPALGSP